MQLHNSASVQRVSIGPRGGLRRQSLFRERASACGGNTLSASSPRLLILRPLSPPAAAADAVHCRTSYSKARPAGSCLANHRRAAPSLAKTLISMESPTLFDAAM